ncbi:MAG: hypothetical protein MEP57_03755 [Microvirga sp.]|nr:hypothetical protein [Microvirga sp.]
MSGADRNSDEDSFNQTLKRMLDTPPKKHGVKAPLTKRREKKEGDGEPDTHRRPAVKKG